MNINLHNVEELIFHDFEIQKLLPEFMPTFNLWHLSRMTPTMRQQGKRAVFDLLNTLEPEHLQILSSYFGREVTLKKVNCDLVEHLDCGLDEAASALSEVEGFVDFAVHRDNDHLYICFWR